MKIGTYYYPEQWPREQWKRDFDNIAAMGLQIVHMAEFAWFSLEPSPGDFRFDWLDECIEMAAKRKLDVILCTPTAAPPVWLSRDFPETLGADEFGRPLPFGGRRHYNPNSPRIREAAARIVTAMADRYGQYSSVIGWQIDNEFGGEIDQSPQSHGAFRDWLHAKYQTIEELNRVWANQFWNTHYTDFSQIELPRSRELNYGNPHQLLDAQRFWSRSFASFNKLQADILKPRVGERFITTNFMPLHPTCDPMEMTDALTLYAWDSYPVSGWDKNVTDETFRIADPAGIGLMHDQMASYTGRWGLMEIQPGQVNWSGVPVLLYPGAVRLWLWTAYAHGAEFITVYRYRQPRWGCEMFHHGLVGTDGITPSAGGREFMQVIDEMRRLHALDGSGIPPTAAPEPAAEPAHTVATVTTPPTPTTVPKASALNPFRKKSKAAPVITRTHQNEVGLLFDFDQLWMYQSLKQAKRWDQGELLRSWYSAIAALGLRVRVLHPSRDWPSDLSMIVAPGLQMADEKLVERWSNFAHGGGHLVLTCRTALMNRDGHLWEGPTAAPIIPLIGATIEAYDGLPDGATASLEIDGSPTRYKWDVWGDLLYAEPSTRTIAKYADQFYAGAAAVTRAKRGSGTVTYCGVYAERAFYRALLERLAHDVDLRVQPLPPRTQMLKRDGMHIMMNYQDLTVHAPAPADAKFLLGSATIEPAGVAVWVE